jgi:hypothetical protein
VQFHPEFDGKIMEAFEKVAETKKKSPKKAKSPRVPDLGLKVGRPITDTPESVELLIRFIHNAFNVEANPQNHANFTL